MRELTVLLALQIYIDFSVARLKDGKRTGWSSGAAGKDRQIKKGGGCLYRSYSVDENINFLK